MAGSYPDVPGRKVQYDLDGSAGFTFSGSGTVALYNTAQLITLNDNTDTVSYPASYSTHGLIFPVPMDIIGYYTVQNGGPATIQTSLDTGNGFDGTWTSQGTVVTGPTMVPGYRTNIQTVSWTTIKAVRFSGTNYIYGLHLYGTPSTGQPRWLAAWNPTTDTELSGAYFDWGDIAQGSMATRTFRVKNLGTLTAQSVVVSVETFESYTPSVAATYTFSVGGGAYASTASLGNLAPGAISSVVTVRRLTTSDAPPSLHAGRYKFSVGSWV